jgi:hypothetical protein
MDFNVQVESRLEFFVKLVSILSLANPVKKLRPKERLLLSHLLFYNDKYKHLDIEDRSRIIFDKSIRLDISEAMNIDSQTFYNNKSQLKMKGVINDEYLTKSFVNLHYKNKFNINFILNGKE